MIVQNEIDHLDIRAIPEIEGLNVVVNAKNGEQLVYVIHAYRMMSGNTFLSNLEVQNSKTNEVFTMSPIYNKIIDSYEVRVPNNVDTVNIIATPEANTTTVNGAGQKNIKNRSKYI